MARTSLLCGGFVLLLSVVVGMLFSREPWRGRMKALLKDKLFLVVPEPAWLGEAVQKEEATELSQDDVQTLKDHGVVLIRGLVKDKGLLEELRKRLWVHKEMPFTDHPLNHKSWLYNGAVRALLRDGPIGDVLGQVYGKEIYVRVNEAPLWGYDVHSQVIPNGWHTDARVRSLMVSIWMVLTDGPVALQFLRGSHIRREEIEEACATFVPGAKMGFKGHDNDCITNYASVLEKNLSMKEPSLFGPELKAGDAFLFSGDVLHRGIRQQYPRIALSLRAIPVEARVSWQTCEYEHPHIYPVNGVMKNDWNCAPWQLLPGIPSIFPLLPSGDLTSSLLRRFFERF